MKALAGDIYLNIENKTNVTSIESHYNHCELNMGHEWVLQVLFPD